MTNADASPSGSSAEPESRFIMNTRSHSNLVGIPYLCNRPACRRARRCRGTTDACLKTYMNAVPEGARTWVTCMSYLMNELELPFEEALAKASELKEAEIYADWMESIGAWKHGREFHRVP